MTRRKDVVILCQLTNGEASEAWNENVKQQKDPGVKWMVKNEKCQYGYKNHVSVDVKHKLIRSYEVTDAAFHDSNVFEELLDLRNTNKDVCADAAYHSRKK